MDATRFIDITYKGAVLSSIGYPANAMVEIDSVDYQVEVLYMFDPSINENQAVSSVASAASVTESKVSATLSTTRRLDMNSGVGASPSKPDLGRRLPTTVDARVSSVTQGEVQAITASIGNSSVVQEAVRVQGVNAIVTVARSPRHKVTVSTRIISDTTQPLPAPDITTLAAHLSSQLDTDVAVTINSVQQVLGSGCHQAMANLFWWGVIFLVCSSVHHY